MLSPTALSRVSPERFKRGLQNCTALSATTSPINLPDMISLAVSGRLQNGQVYLKNLHAKIVPQTVSYKQLSSQIAKLRALRENNFTI